MSSPCLYPITPDEQPSISFQSDLEEQQYTFSDGIFNFEKTTCAPVPIPTRKEWLFQNIYEGQLALDYLKYSKEIKPGLTIRDLIFPFHNFQ